MFASERASWQNPRILALLLLIFMAGGLAGAFAMRTYHWRMHQALAFQAGDRNQLSYDRLKQELGLTPEQADKLKTILNDMVRYNQSIQEQIDDYRATGKNRIRAILKPDQQQTFERLCLEVQSR